MSTYRKSQKRGMFGTRTGKKSGLDLPCLMRKYSLRFTQTLLLIYGRMFDSRTAMRLRLGLPYSMQEFLMNVSMKFSQTTVLSLMLKLSRKYKSVLVLNFLMLFILMGTPICASGFEVSPISLEIPTKKHKSISDLTKSTKAGNSIENVVISSDSVNVNNPQDSLQVRTMASSIASSITSSIASSNTSSIDSSNTSSITSSNTSSIVSSITSSIASSEAESKVPLRTFIQKVEAETAYRFLYRDALISRVVVTSNAIDSDDKWIPALNDELRAQKIGLHIDFLRNQIILFEIKDPVEDRDRFMLRGSVVDAETGNSMAYATVQWYVGGSVRGTITDQNGRFQMVVGRAFSSSEIVVSYVGYLAESVRLGEILNGLEQDNHLSTRERLHQIGDSEITIRLRPNPIMGPAILVSSSHFRMATDTLVGQFSRFGQFGAFGEGSAVRTLQPLASVGLSGAMSSGLQVRGSSPDGMQVLLDGVAVYNQNHLFGLFDPFNRDALQSVGFYYDVVPASFAAPPGGTLVYNTRTGSQIKPQYSAGISNSAVRATLEGPIRGGQGSWLVSGRNSYLNEMNWFNNRRLITWGLDVDRESESPRNGISDISAQTVFPGVAEARFFDIHSKLMFDSQRSGVWSGSFYFGGDYTYQEAERFTGATQGAPNPNREFDLIDVNTTNKWSNWVLSAQNRYRAAENKTLHTQVSASFYTSEFDKDDYLFVRVVPQTGQLRAFFGEFSQNNRLFHTRASHALHTSDNHGNRLHLGVEANYFDVIYDEISAARPDFRLETTSFLGDLFAQYDVTHWQNIHVFGGLRLHYYSLGDYFRLSPRLMVRVLPEERVHFGLGYSRNYQFLHSVSLKNISSAQIWVSSLSYQSPAEVDNFTGGIYASLWNGAVFQTEGYYKIHRNARVHEVNNTLVSNRDSFLESPWFSTGEMVSRGIETQLLQRFGVMKWSGSYTYSIVEMQNEWLNRGERFYADWDRRHQIFTGLTAEFGSGFSANISAVFATGAPHYTVENAVTVEDRLDDYLRYDFGAGYGFVVGNTRVQANFNVFNLTNRRNVWYRSPVMVADRTTRPVRLRFEDLDVYDLGILPSFDISVQF